MTESGLGNLFHPGPSETAKQPPFLSPSLKRKAGRLDKNCPGRWNHFFFRTGQTRASLKGAGNVPSCNEEFITAWTLPITVLEAFTNQEEQGSDWKVVALITLRSLNIYLDSTGLNYLQITEQDLSPGISQGPCTTLGFHEYEYMSHVDWSLAITVYSAQPSLSECSETPHLQCWKHWPFLGVADVPPPSNHLA